MERDELSGTTDPSTLRVKLVAQPAGEVGPDAEWPPVGQLWLTGSQRPDGLFTAEPRATGPLGLNLQRDEGQQIEGLTWEGEVPGHLWHRLKVQLPGYGTRVLCLEPFHGTKEVKLEFQHGGCGVQVVVWAPDLRAPAADHPVEIALRDKVANTVSQAIRSAETDSFGLATFQGLEPGSYIARVVGLRDDQFTPHAVSFEVRPSLGLDSPTVHLVAPTVELPVRFMVRAEDLPSGSDPAILAARKIDLPIGEIVPIVRRVTPGTQEVVAHLPEGIWELISVPENSLVIDCDQSPLAVQNSGDALPSLVGVSLKAATQTDVRLVGIPPRAFPWTVHTVATGRPERTVPGLLHVGPRKWRRAEQPISLQAPRHLVALTRRGNYLSEYPVMPGYQGEVAMVEATTVHITAPDRPSGQPIVELTVGDMTQLVPLAQRLSPAGEGAAATWSAQAFMPPGGLDARCSWPDGEVREIKAASSKRSASLSFHGG